MATAVTFTTTGNKATKNTTLPKDVFAVTPVSHDLLHQTYTAVHTNQRARSAHSKTRAAVRGGGRKPWRQKGTGNARAGSIRSPIWRGGGITFGPDGSQVRRRQLNKAAKRTAMRHALSLRAGEEAVAVIEDIKTDGTVKSARKVIDKLPLHGNLIFVVDSVTPDIERSMRNIPNVAVTEAATLNVVDILNADYLVFTRKSLERIKQRLGAGS